MQNYLISRSEVLDFIKKELKQDRPDDFKLRNIQRFVQDLPTSYNVEKVIEQLEQEETEWCDKYCEEKAKGNIDLYVDGFGEGLTRALWIVRNGGKE